MGTNPKHLRALIIDDEKNVIRSIELSLKECCPDVQVVGFATSAETGIQEIERLKPDLVFLDIQMPHMSGIELLETIRNKNFEVIFVTAYSEYAVKAFKLNAVDYLLKPINMDELINAVKKVGIRLGSPSVLDLQLGKLRASMSGKIAVPSSGGTEYLNIADIIRIKAEGSYSEIFTLDGRKKMVSKNLKELQDILANESFFRTHKSHLVNLTYVKKFHALKDGGIIDMSDDSRIKVSRVQKPGLVQLLNSGYKI